MPVSPDDFRDVLRHFPAGVTLVTIKAGDETHGLTVSSFVSVSAEPPLVLVCIDNSYPGNELIHREDAVFAVNILGAGQEEISNHFAFGEGDRFAKGDWTTAETGAPILEDGLAWLDCKIHSLQVAGTHTVCIGEVQASKVITPDAAPLVYWNRAYRSIVESQE